MLTVTQAAELLRTFDNVLILTHVRPDGDTVGGNNLLKFINIMFYIA